MSRRIHYGNRTDTRAYNSWRAMKARCTYKNHPHYANYGGRGIQFCSRWSDFDVFLADMGECPEGCSLERLDSDKDYSPDNCVWATRTEQNRNRSNTVYLEFRGESKPLVEWSEIVGIKVKVIEGRLKMGWSVERALTEPVLYKSPKTLITYKGESRTVSDWEKKLGLGSRTLYQRLFKYGWPVEKALNTPVRKKSTHE